VGQLAALGTNPRKDPSAWVCVVAPLLKICGLKQPAQAAAIAAMGANAIGVIAVERSPRFVPAFQRQALFDAVHTAAPTCLGVVVVADPPDDDLPLLAAGQGHQVLQLHGNETPEHCLRLRDQLGGVQLWKALRIRSPGDLEQVQSYQDVVDAVLLDAWVDGVLGGTGQRLPSTWLRGWSPPLPWWLAGGLTPGNAAEVLSQLQPSGIDVSSGVEDSPGDKNLELVRQLMAAIGVAGQDQGLPMAR